MGWEIIAQRHYQVVYSQIFSSFFNYYDLSLVDSNDNRYKITQLGIFIMNEIEGVLKDVCTIGLRGILFAFRDILLRIFSC
jgi:hypothetical protein